MDKLIFRLSADCANKGDEVYEDEGVTKLLYPGIKEFGYIAILRLRDTHEKFLYEKK